MKKVKKLLFALGLMFILPIVVHAEGVTKLCVDMTPQLCLNNLNHYQMNAQLTTSLDYATIIAEPETGWTITGDGRVPVQEGLNEIKVVATNAAGQTSQYTINLTVHKATAEEMTATDTNGNPNTGASLNYIFVAGGVLIAGGILYYAYRKNRVYKI